MILDDFNDIEKDNNMVIISIPTLLDPNMAPDGHHVRHAHSNPPSANRNPSPNPNTNRNLSLTPQLTRSCTRTTRLTSRTSLGRASTEGVKSAPARVLRRPGKVLEGLGRPWNVLGEATARALASPKTALVGEPSPRARTTAA